MNRFSIASDNGLSPIRHQAIIWINAWLLSNGPLGTNFNEISMKIQSFSFTKMHNITSMYTTWNYDDNISSRLNTSPISTHNEAIVSQEIISKMHRISFRLTTKVSRAPVDNNETFMKGLGMSCNMQGLHLGLIGRFFIASLLLPNLWPTIVPKHCIHDDVIKWKHFLCYWPFVRGIHRWIPRTKVSDAELWYFLRSAPEQTIEQTIVRLVISDAIALIMTSL